MVSSKLRCAGPMGRREVVRGHARQRNNEQLAATSSGPSAAVRWATTGGEAGYKRLLFSSSGSVAFALVVPSRGVVGAFTFTPVLFVLVYFQLFSLSFLNLRLGCMCVCGVLSISRAGYYALARVNGGPSEHVYIQNACRYADYDSEATHTTTLLQPPPARRSSAHLLLTPAALSSALTLPALSSALPPLPAFRWPRRCASAPAARACPAGVPPAACPRTPASHAPAAPARQHPARRPGWPESSAPAPAVARAPGARRTRIAHVTRPRRAAGRPSGVRRREGWAV
eukprot:scaffold6185_cov132-Isochrysis_galbana.AAC.2